MKRDPKVMKAALKGIAESMAKLHIDKIKGYKKKMEESEKESEEEDDDYVKVLEAQKRGL